jgi:DNA uptake protein ComE-like DNA-binding protein
MMTASASVSARAVSSFGVLGSPRTDFSQKTGRSMRPRRARSPSAATAPEAEAFPSSSTTPPWGESPTAASPSAMPLLNFTTSPRWHFCCAKPTSAMHSALPCASMPSSGSPSPPPPTAVAWKFPASARTFQAMLARIRSLAVEVISPTRVVVNEKTGTIVMGRDARLGAASILQGSLSIEIATSFEVSQPNPLSKAGETTVVPQTTVSTRDGPAKRIELNEGATVEQLVNGLQTIGASARDGISILQARKAAGALQAELEVL